MNTKRTYIVISVAVVSSLAGCAKRNTRPRQDTQTFCAHQKHITATTPWTENWEGCVEGWRSLSGESLVPAIDATSPAGSKVQALTKLAPDGENTFYSPWLAPIEITGGQSYCMGAWFKWGGGHEPFMGIRQFSATLVDTGVDDRLIGAGDTSGAFRTPKPLNRNSDGWQWVEQSFTLPTATGYIQVFDGLDKDAEKPGEPVAHVDGLSIQLGACTGAQVTCD